MPLHPETTAPVNDCWNKIGVWGNGECPEVPKFGHCRNCPVYAAAAVKMLDRELPAEYRREWTSHFAKEKPLEIAATRSVLIFRIGTEWLAMATETFRQVAGLRTIHSLPHRRNGTVLGLVNIRGELLVCVSLADVLGVEKVETNAVRSRARLLVASREGSRLVFPADEVHGVHRFGEHEIAAAPATVAKAPSTYVRGALSWQGRTVGLLDDQLLFYTLNRSLA